MEISQVPFGTVLISLVVLFYLGTVGSRPSLEEKNGAREL